MTQTPKRRGRPPRVTKEQIAQAVVEVGFVDLTFAAVKNKLGVGETTLYRHAPDRDQLVRLGMDYVVRQTEWPPLDGGWRQILSTFAFAAWRLFESHPGSATEAARGIVSSETMVLMSDLGAALMGQGFTASKAVLACDVVFDMVTDNRRGIEHLDAIVPTAGPGRQQMDDMWFQRENIESVDADRRAIDQALHEAIVAEPIDWFSAKLEVVLDGVGARLAP